MSKKHFQINFHIIILYIFFQLNAVQAQVFFENLSFTEINSIEGEATWEDTARGFEYNNNGTNSDNRALLYTPQAYQSSDGLILTIE